MRKLLLLPAIFAIISCSNADKPVWESVASDCLPSYNMCFPTYTLKYISGPQPKTLIARYSGAECRTHLVGKIVTPDGSRAVLGSMVSGTEFRFYANCPNYKEPNLIGMLLENDKEVTWDLN